jgi:hypothetical protein
MLINFLLNIKNINIKKRCVDWSNNNNITTIIIINILSNIIRRMYHNIKKNLPLLMELIN